MKYKYIFLIGAPGSKWSSVNKNIYYSPDIDRSDYSSSREYWHDAPGKLMLMHIGAYFDPGMECELPERLNTLTKEQLESLFNAPFSGTGVRIIKSHIFSYLENIDHLKKLWPECPIVLCYRNDDECLGWWVKCGHFGITYPSYHAYYKDLREMSKIIVRQNEGILLAEEKYDCKYPFDNTELCQLLNVTPPAEEYKQVYSEADVKVVLI